MPQKIRLLGLISFRSTTDPKTILNLVREYAQQTASDAQKIKYINELTDDLKPENVDLLVAEIEKLTGLEPHPSVVNKLRAYANLINNPIVLKEWHLFEKIANALMDGIFDSEHVDPPSDVELVYTAYIFRRDAMHKAHEISNEVKRYVQTLWQKEYGFLEPHPWLLPFWPLPKTVNTILVQQKHDELLAKRDSLTKLTLDDLLKQTDPINTQAIRMAMLSLEVLNAL
ncbi:MAG: hypothetical protein QXE80_03240 [Pyrobaculum sp.]